MSIGLCNGRRSDRSVGSPATRSTRASSQSSQGIVDVTSVTGDAIDLIALDLIDEVAMGVMFDVHREFKTGLLDVISDCTDSNQNAYTACNRPGFDIFDQSIYSAQKQQWDCQCPQCHRTLGATRLAPHLEKCMGMGRSSSRVASRRIAETASHKQVVTSSRNASPNSSNDESDDDWSENLGGGRRRPRKKALHQQQRVKPLTNATSKTRVTNGKHSAKRGKKSVSRSVTPDRFLLGDLLTEEPSNDSIDVLLDNDEPILQRLQSHNKMYRKRDEIGDVLNYPEAIDSPELGL